MRDVRCSLRIQTLVRNFIGAIPLLTLLLAPAIWAQNAKAPQQSGGTSAKQDKDSSSTSQSKKLAELPWTKDSEKYPGLQDELSKLFVKLKDGVQLPQPRTESQLLPLLPGGTVIYGAVPNYGATAEQILTIFRQQLQESAVLRDWWEHGELTKDAPKVLSGIEKFQQLEAYLGGELVISLDNELKEGNFLVVAQTMKPGLKEFLEAWLAEASKNQAQDVHVLAPQDLATYKEKTPKDLLILVREDYVLAADKLDRLKKFDAQLSAKLQPFSSTPFGKRVEAEYPGGITFLGAGDLHSILRRNAPELEKSDTFQQSGFADMQYLVWDRKLVSGKPLNQMELSFTGPRHGSAAWIANPQKLGSLDFVSPDAILAATLVLANPGKILEGAESLAHSAHSKTFDALPAFEQMLGLSVKDDFLALLGGELSVEVSGLDLNKPDWTTILSVKDSEALQRTLNKLMASAQILPDQIKEDGVIYSSVAIPGQGGPTKLSYAFTDGYWVIGPTRRVVAAAIQLQRSGNGLGKTEALTVIAPPGHGLVASGLFYENPILAAKFQMQKLQEIAPELLQSLDSGAHLVSPVALWLYGEDTSIRELSVSPSIDVTGVLVVAAIAIPNLLRSKIAANEASAVGSVRTINTAQVTYEAEFPGKGYAKSLGALGPDPRGPRYHSAEHDALVDASLACSGTGWCVKSGYQFQVVASSCAAGPCKQYVVTATPVNSSTGTRSFCSSSDAIIRYKSGDPLSAPLTPEECKSWVPLK